MDQSAPAQTGKPFYDAEVAWKKKNVLGGRLDLTIKRSQSKIMITFDQVSAICRARQRQKHAIKACRAELKEFIQCLKTLTPIEGKQLYRALCATLIGGIK